MAEGAPVRNELHRAVAVDAFARYLGDMLTVRTHDLGQLEEGDFLQQPFDCPCIYVLRLDRERIADPTIRAIPNALDRKGILYIGGHPSGKPTGRFNALIDACRKAERYFADHGHAGNDKTHRHSVAACLTTGLLKAGFTLSACMIDLIRREEGVDELELIIGYQERYHHLPPWNTVRGGASAYVEMAT